MSAKSTNWAESYSSDEDDEEIEELVEEKPLENENVIKQQQIVCKTDADSFIPPYVVEILCKSFQQSTVDRKTIGNYFECEGCKIQRLDFNLSSRIAYMELKDSASMLRSLSMNEVLFLNSPLSIQPVDNRAIDRNISNSRNRYVNEQVNGRGRGRSRDNDRRDRPYNNDRRSYSSSNPPSEPPVTRPKLVLAPRTLPLDTIGKPVSSLLKPEIFGEGRPQDEQEFVSSSFLCFYLSAFIGIIDE